MPCDSQWARWVSWFLVPLRRVSSFIFEPLQCGECACLSLLLPMPSTCKNRVHRWAHQTSQVSKLLGPQQSAEESASPASSWGSHRVEVLGSHWSKTHSALHVPHSASNKGGQWGWAQSGHPLLAWMCQRTSERETWSHFALQHNTMTSYCTKLENLLLAVWSCLAGTCVICTWTSIAAIYHVHSNPFDIIMIMIYRLHMITYYFYRVL